MKNLKDTLEQFRHSSDCKYKNSQIPDNECPCDCYERYIWNNAVRETLKICIVFDDDHTLLQGYIKKLKEPYRD